MATKTWKGGAGATAQVTTVTPANVEVGDTFSLIINNQTITVTATAATAANVVDLLKAAIDASTIPEWQEVTATDSGDYLTLTGPSDGRPFTVTSATGNATAFTVTVTETRKGVAATNEKQTVQLPTATGGTFRLIFNGNSTGDIAYNASAATVQSALEALSGIIGAGDVTVTGSAGGPWTIEFTGTYEGVNVSTLVGNGDSLTGAGSVEITTTTQGAPAQNEIQSVVTPASGEPFTLRWVSPGGTIYEPSFASYAQAFDVQTIVDARFGTGRIVVTEDTTYTPTGTWDKKFLFEFVGPWAGMAINLMTEPALQALVTIARVQTGNSTGINEVQTIAVQKATGGNFTLTLLGETTGNITYSATAATLAANIETALEALSGVGVGEATVAVGTQGTNQTTFTVTFSGALAATDIGPMTANAAGLTGGPVYVTTTTAATAAVNELQTITVGGGPAGGTFTLTYDAEETGDLAYNISAANLAAALEGLSTIGSGQVSVTGAAGGPWLVEFTGTLAATDVGLITSDASSLTGGGTQALTVATPTAATGPHHYNNANNWVEGAIPVDADDVVFEHSSVDCLYGLAQSAVTPASFTVKASYTGKIGLEPHTGSYTEYRDQYLALGDADDTTNMVVRIGEGPGSGSPMIRIDNGDGQATIDVFNTGSPSSATLPAFTWKGSHASNAMRVYKGSVGIGVQAGEVAVLTTLHVAYVSRIDDDAEVVCGDLAKPGTVTQTGGTLIIGGRSSTAVTALTISAGECTINGTDAVTALTILGGTVYYNSTGALGGNPVVAGDGLLDFSRDMRTKTVTNPIELHGNDSVVRDPHKVITSLVVDLNQRRALEDWGTNIRLTRGSVA